jgi:hypothetical protein
VHRADSPRQVHDAGRQRRRGRQVESAGRRACAATAG